VKTILVPTDFSDHAFYALKVAASIAKRIHAGIKLVHVYNIPPAEFADNCYYEEFYNQIQARVNDALLKLANNDFLSDINTHKYFIADSLLWEVLQDRRFSDADLIVMGSHGKSRFNKVFIGSNTEKVVRLANSPVLTIKKEINDFNIGNIVFASNFYGESYAAFNKIKFFADIYKSHISLLKVITPKEFEPTQMSRNLMEDFAQKFNLTNYSSNIYNAMSIEKGITDFSNEVNADLIAIETHGKTGIAHLINGSLAEDVVKHEDRPVLSVKIKDPPSNISGLRWYLEKIEKTHA
jgi:nucleotide-binding universal stress UspA family protein